MLKTDEYPPRQGTSFVDNRLKAHKMLRVCNLHPLYLVVKSVDLKSGASSTKAGWPLCPESEVPCGAEATDALERCSSKKNLLYNRHSHKYDLNGVRRSGFQVWHPD